MEIAGGRICISVSKNFLTLKPSSDGQANLVRELALCPRQGKSVNLSGMRRKKCFGDETRKRWQRALVSSSELKHIQLNKSELTPSLLPSSSSSSSSSLLLFYTTCYTQQGRCRTPLPPILALGTKLQVCLCPRAWPHPFCMLGLSEREGNYPHS